MSALPLPPLCILQQFTSTKTKRGWRGFHSVRDYPTRRCARVLTATLQIELFRDAGTGTIAVFCVREGFCFAVGVLHA